ncbi:MAG: alpha/beta hydrolase [Candidatus Saccharibacteria bacterium]|nr:alpha/beta hydrolase [Candidatus Saccharibacteria bacterium]
MISKTFGETAYWQYGTVATGPIFVLIHGFRGTHHGLSAIAERLKGTVVVPDLPGFGESQALKSHHIEDYSSWLDDFITAIAGQQTIVLIGHSFGSIICAHYAATHGERLKQLILINPIGESALKGPRKILTAGAVLFYKIGRMLPDKLAKPWLSSQLMVDTMSHVMTKSKDPTLKADIVDQHRRYFSRFSSPASLDEAFRTSVSKSVRDVAPQITTKTLLIAGERDDITSIRQQQSVHALFTNATLKIIPNVGHLTHYETPDQVVELIEAFITRS